MEEKGSREVGAGLGARKCSRRESIHCTRKAGQVDLRKNHQEGCLYRAQELLGNGVITFSLSFHSGECLYYLRHGTLTTALPWGPWGLHSSRTLPYWLPRTTCRPSSLFHFVAQSIQYSYEPIGVHRTPAPASGVGVGNTSYLYLEWGLLNESILMLEKASPSLSHIFSPK